MPSLLADYIVIVGGALAMIIIPFLLLTILSHTLVWIWQALTIAIVLILL